MKAVRKNYACGYLEPDYKRKGHEKDRLALVVMSEWKNLI
jgi:hypothetical protein